MNWYLAQTAPPDIPLATEPAPSWGDRFGAAMRAQRIEDDSLGQSESVRRSLDTELFDLLPDDLRAQAEAPVAKNYGSRIRRPGLIAALGVAAARDPEFAKDWRTATGAAVPTDPQTFEDLVRSRRQAQYDEQRAILGAAPAGSWGAEFLGRSFAGLTDEVSLATLPMGAPGRLPLMLRVAGEFGLGAASELAIAPRRQQVAAELNVPDPNPVLDVLGAGAAAAGFTGLVGLIAEGAGRVVRYRQTRGEAMAGARPGDVSPGEHEAAIEGRAVSLAAPSETAAPAQPATAGPPDFRSFDFSAAGNASPRTNRIGYVFGRLLSKGYEPTQAAAILGNLMQESGFGLNTGARGDGGNSFGMVQWNGPRRVAYLEFARKRGGDPSDIDAQIDFLDAELQGAAGGWSNDAARRAFLASTDPREAAELASKYFWRPGDPWNQNRRAYAASVFDQYQGGAVPKWNGARVYDDGASAAPYSTRRGYTATGEVSTAEGGRIAVDYEVVDARLLQRATGDLQPRDRSRATSDAWIADTAARLDPAQLMPSPTVDRGTPIVGPDNVVESGNGRLGAILRAYDEHPDRAAAYRGQIEAAGYAVPEGVERPVLIARRTSAMTDAERHTFVIAAQDSGVARMTPTEIARASARAMTGERLATFRPDARLTDPENLPFVRSTLSALPRSERNALFEAGGQLNAEGLRRLRHAFFARAWGADPEILARYAELEDAGELKSLIDALDQAAPDWAALLAEIEAGAVRAEFDITGHVLEAMQIIAAARTEAAAGGTVRAALDNILAQGDLFDAISPLTRALVAKFMPEGRPAPAATIADFLTRYAREARTAGRSGDLLGAGPAEVLRALDPKGFGGLPDEIGAARQRPALTARPADDLPETAYADGALSPEAAEADALAIEDLRAANSETRAAAAAARAEFGDMVLRVGDEDVPAARLLDEIEADEELADVLMACKAGGPTDA